MAELPPGVTDPVVFERQCRDALARHLGQPYKGKSSHLKPTEVTLRGDFPETDFVIRYHDRRDDRDGVFVTELWPEAKEAWTPEEVAIAVSILLMEH